VRHSRAGEARAQAAAGSRSGVGHAATSRRFTRGEPPGGASVI
jgi:hypothetical protein